MIDSPPTLAFIEDSWNQLLVPAERLAEVQEHIESARAGYEVAVRDANSRDGWDEADDAVEFLLLQSRVDRAVLRREAEINRERRAAGSVEQSAASLVPTRIRRWWKR